MHLFATLIHPPILFFVLGLLASLLKSNLEIPEPIQKFLSIYLLMVIGLRGGYELSRVGLSPHVIVFLLICVFFSFLIPIVCYFVLRLKENIPDSVLIASCYGSVSAVTFLTASAFLHGNNIQFDGYLTAALAVMEFPAIIIGLIIYYFFSHSNNKLTKFDIFKNIINRSLLDSSIFLLLGSIIIGYLCGHEGREELQAFTSDIFNGMLCFYLLNIGIKAGKEVYNLITSSIYLIAFAIIVPIINGSLGIMVSFYILHFDIGNCLLVTMLFASASYIAVPASMRTSIPEANVGVAVTLTLVVTFVFNVIVAMPIYYQILLCLFRNYSGTP